MGTLVNIATAYLISRVRVQTLAVVSALITMIAPVLMATIKVDEDYWFAPFWALFLSPMNPDGLFVLILRVISQRYAFFRGATQVDLNIAVLFTVSNLVISDAFPSDIQSLAGGVFNEVAQFGNSVGLAVTAAIAASITEHAVDVQDHREALMQGYRAAFWTIFASAAVVVVVVSFGLRKGGTVGKKDD